MARPDTLQLARPERFLRAERRVQRVGLLCLTAFVAAGAAGAFGGGPLSTVTTRAGGTAVTYERFGRTTAPTVLAIEVSSTAPPGKPVTFRLDREFMRDLDFLEVRPASAFRGFDADSAIFEVEPIANTGHVELHFKPRRPGIYRTAVTPEGGTRTTIRQFIYY
jgi:hypothetical protein